MKNLSNPRNASDLDYFDHSYVGKSSSDLEENDARGLPQAGLATPNLDGPITNVSASGIGYIDGLLSGVRWNTSNITFSFPDQASDYEVGYANGAPLEDFGQLSASQQAILRAALDGNTWRSLDGFTPLNTIDNGISADSTLRAAYSSDPGGSAYAYYPSSAYYGGDMWFGTFSSYNYATAKLGSSGYRSTLHELGHALGLKHGHETGGPANVAMPVEYRHHEFTVMPYISYEGGPLNYTNEVGGFPQSFMMADIAALQYMYGANFTGTDSIYTWSETTGEMFVNGVGQGAPNDGAGGIYNRIFLTVWDGNGKDTYDASNYSEDVSLDLRPGYASVLSTEQLAYLGGGPRGGYARGNVYNALMYNGDARSLIENATGGLGEDVLLGNFVRNVLLGGAGNDRSLGGGGSDSLFGEGGNDKLFGNKGDDFITGGAGADRLAGSSGADHFIFRVATHSSAAAFDTITDFHAPEADNIDLSMIDANSKAGGNQKFSFIDDNPFHGKAGELRIVDKGDRIHVLGDTNGDRKVDLQIVVLDVNDLNAGAFIL